MRCLACDVELSEFESTRRYSRSREFLDLCNKCASLSLDDSSVEDREDLRSLADINDAYEEAGNVEDWAVDY